MQRKYKAIKEGKTVERKPCKFGDDCRYRNGGGCDRWHPQDDIDEQKRQREQSLASRALTAGILRDEERLSARLTEDQESVVDLDDMQRDCDLALMRIAVGAKPRQVSSPPVTTDDDEDSSDSQPQQKRQKLDPGAADVDALLNPL